MTNLGDLGVELVHGVIHRATDGATGARFLHVLAQKLRRPEDL